MQSAFYSAFGYAIKSDIPLPELKRLDEGATPVDIIIKCEDLTSAWRETETTPGGFYIEPDCVMFEVVDHAIFSIRSGNEIIVSLCEHYELDVVRLYLLGSCMGALLMQRRIVPLHGSAIEIDGQAYAFIGHSGAGKSTLATVFIDMGYSLVSDDIIPLNLLDHKKVATVTPSYPQQKLWQRSLDHFGMNDHTFRPIYGRGEKYCIPVSSYRTEPLPLAALFELDKTANDDIIVQQVTGLERLLILFVHTYRNFMLNPLGLLEWHFDMSTSIGERVPLYRIHRPEHGFTAYALANHILETIEKEGMKR